MSELLSCGGESVYRLTIHDDVGQVWYNQQNHTPIPPSMVYHGSITLINGTEIQFSTERLRYRYGKSALVPRDSTRLAEVLDRVDELEDKVDDLSNALTEALKSCAPNVRKRITTMLGGDWADG